MNPALFGVIALGTILGMLVFGFVGYAYSSWRQSRLDELKLQEWEWEAAQRLTNLDRAVDLIEQIEQIRAVQRELKSAFARSELDGGARAALNHPLYVQAQAKLDELHDALMILI